MRLPTPPPTLKVPAGDDMGQALDALNAWGCLETWQEVDLKSITSFGPGVFRGYLPQPWTGVILWYKQRGYYHYATLYMIGVWALRHAAHIQIVVGSKNVAYAQPLFNAEGYHRRIQTEFRTLYHDDGSPPTETHYRYSAIYDPTRRLELRQAVTEVVKAWAGAPLF